MNEKPAALPASKKQKALETVKNTSIETVFFLTKMIQLTLAMLMVVFSVIKIGLIEQSESLTGFMINFYFLFFGLIFMLVECNFRKCRMWFYILNSSLGKALFHTFLFVLCFGSGHDAHFLDILLGVILILTASFMMVLHCFFREQEAAHIDMLIN